MGKEAECPVRLDGTEWAGKAHLDSVTLTIRGGRRLSLSLTDIRSATAAGGTLRLKTALGTVELDLGARLARTWCDAIVAPKGLMQKLGIRFGDRVCVNNLHDAQFCDDLAVALGEPPVQTLRGTFDIVIVGAASAADLAAVARARSCLTPSGAIWIVYEKGKASPVPERIVRDAGLGFGLVDVKVVSFSVTHTALKFVIPLAQR